MNGLWTDFLNSEWHDWRGSGRSEDRLDRQGWFAGLLENYHLEDSVPAAAEDWERIKQVRRELRRIAGHLADGRALTEEQLGRINGWLKQGPVVRRLRPAEGEGMAVSLEPCGEGPGRLIAEIAASFADELAAGAEGRIRICGNPDCRWVFVDETRNRSKRFCDDKSCGNLMKVRRFRARHKPS